LILTYNFIVEAYSVNGYVSTSREYTIHVNRKFDIPYNNVYAQAMPALNDRTIIDGLLSNTSIFPKQAIYRPDDRNFGVSQDITYLHAVGLNPDSLDNYALALTKNHYRKPIVLGSIKTARALDDNGNVLYEVLYSENC